MGESSVVAILSLAFGLGLLHALDADHIAAVTGLASQEEGGRRQALRFSLMWALGHGLTLLLVGVAVILLGMAIPAQLSEWAETLVGVVLVVIGIGVLLDIRRENVHLHFHRHDSGLPHAHWHHHTPGREHRASHHRHRHTPVLVGVLHGAAGSAPLLALLPMTQQQDPWLAMGYLLLFGVGVLASMLLFGGFVEHLFNHLKRRARRLLYLLRSVVGLFSIGLGGWLFYHAFV
ncbi:hypothetical protein BOW53_07530 [Solemya pervernicosa gill symbiont]|uniref:Nickel/cobalt efflux system n=1 Tax=Solemya pervernicosa gill symbiont TaxID=642797 RepID=A0A1T2L618_9GAMM|nr:sulfite exporter TauE/SafE family protein [Solemya pervernicosa gill symbiont]OOZ40502.1 hypothetical protein BOW53_07530 [Solemya pervernicosa gill symbiont]